MASRMLVGSRKGLFVLEPQGGGPRDSWKIARQAFIGEPVSQVLHDPRDGSLYVALNLGHFGAQLHRSDDGGSSWTEVATPAFPKLEGKEDAEPRHDLGARSGGPRHARGDLGRHHAGRRPPLGGPGRDLDPNAAFRRHPGQGSVVRRRQLTDRLASDCDPSEGQPPDGGPGFPRRRLDHQRCRRRPGHASKGDVGRPGRLRKTEPGRPGPASDRPLS